jgi:hypothetical protein
VLALPLSEQLAEFSVRAKGAENAPMQRQAHRSGCEMSRYFFMSRVATVNTGMTAVYASTRRKMQPPMQPKSLLNLHKMEINIGVSPSP